MNEKKDEVKAVQEEKTAEERIWKDMKYDQEKHVSER